MIKETFSAGKFIQNLAQQTGGSGYGELVDELIAEMKGMSSKDAKAKTTKFEAKDMSSLRSQSKQAVSDGASAAAGLPGEEGYKRWILDMARAVAATKTGGFMGIGNKSVIHEKEQAALDELAAVMGL